MSELQEFVSDQTLAELAALMDEPSLDAMRADPGFPATARSLVALWRLPDGEDDRIVAHSLRDLGRFIGGMWALFLYSSPGGLTQARLGRLLEITKVASASRARSILIYLQFIGFITPVARTRDAREKHFRPTAKLVGAFKSRQRREFEILATLYPEAGEMLRHFDEPGAMDIAFELMGEIFLAYMSMRGRPGPSLEMFSQRFAGMLLLGELLGCADPEDSYPPRGPLRFNTSALAKRCGISRTQVRRAFQDAAAVGFLVLPEEGVALPTDLLREHLELTHAGLILGGHWCARNFVARAAQGKALYA